MVLSNLHFITQSLPTLSNEELVERVCINGVKLIQLRIKNQSLDYIYNEAKIIKEICNKHKATLILNDHVSIVKDLNLDGVHLGKSDLPPSEARNILGKNSIIGGTANNIDDIKNLIKAQVNYIGLGPYKYTTTKKNLSPILGIDGYSSIIKELDASVNVPPIYAIGGIELNDIKKLLNLGLYGVAISGLISNSNNVNKTIKEINEILS